METVYKIQFLKCNIIILQNGSKTPVLQARQKNVTPAKKRKLVFQQQQQEFMTVCADVLKQKDPIEEYDALGIHVAAKMKKINPMQQILAEALKL